MRSIRVWDDANNQLTLKSQDGSVTIYAEGLRFEYHTDDGLEFVVDDIDEETKTLKLIRKKK